MKKVLNKNSIYYLIIFIIIFLMSYLIPYGGDDYGNYFIKGSSFIEIINASINKYMTIEGRFFSRIFDYLLVPHVLLWSIIKSMLMVLFIYMINKIIGSDKKYILPLIVLLTLCVDTQIFGQVYTWKTGSVTYFIPLCFMILLIYLRRNVFTEKEVYKNKLLYLLIPLTFIFSMFNEAISIGIIITCLLNIIFYYKKYKKVDYLMTGCLISSIIGLVLMMTSPGTMVRLDDETSSSTLDTIFSNIPNLINYTFIRNTFLILFMVLVLNVINKRYTKNKILKIFIMLYITIVPLITALVRIVSYFIDDLPRIFTIFLDSTKWYIDLYWILFALLFTLLIFLIFKSENKSKLLYFYILALAGNGSMLLSPVWGGRTSCITVFMFYILLLIILVELNIEVLLKMTYIINILIIIISIVLIGYILCVYSLNKVREEYIECQLKDNNESYEIIILPGYFAWNLNTWGSDGDFADNFRKYYDMKEDADLIYVSKNDVLDKLKECSISV